jgi:NAD(P)H-flavin reductase/ferredoxin
VTRSAGRLHDHAEEAPVAAKVTVMPFGETLGVEPGEALLGAVLRQGRFVRYGCKHGGCGTCRAQLVSGECVVGAQTSFSLSDDDRSAGIVLLCSTYAEDDEVVVDVTDTMDLTADEFAAGQTVVECAAVVEGLDGVTHDIQALRLALPPGVELAFTAGQYVEVQVPGSVGEWRSFSMANPPADSTHVDLLVKVIPGGRFSSALATTVRRGDTMRLRGPFGQFGIRLSHRPIVMVAGGSGMAPIRSMLADLAARGNERPVTFFYGARCDRDLFDVAVLEAFAAEHAWFTFVPALSDPDGNVAGWDGECGLVTDVLDRRLAGDLRQVEAYLCGPPPMIDAAIALLTRRGCRPRHVFFDRFVPSG